MELSDFFRLHPAGAVAFSGGVDSSLLVWAAARYGSDWRAYYVHSPFQPAFELADARQVAGQCGLPLTVLEVDVLQNETVAANPPDRCYHCKHSIFSVILDRARQDGCSLVIDGTNASDDAGDRPGMRALRELEVRSPLRECGLTKAAVRQLSREAGLPTWDKPAYACLATRVPSGTALTAELLQSVEAAETALAELGFRDFRVRARHGMALVQVTEAQWPLAAARRDELQKRLRPLFESAALDLVPRTLSE